MTDDKNPTAIPRKLFDAIMDADYDIGEIVVAIDVGGRTHKVPLAVLAAVETSRTLKFRGPHGGEQEHPVAALRTFMTAAKAQAVIKSEGDKVVAFPAANSPAPAPTPETDPHDLVATDARATIDRGRELLELSRELADKATAMISVGETALEQLDALRREQGAN